MKIDHLLCKENEVSYGGPHLEAKYIYLIFPFGLSRFPHGISMSSSDWPILKKDPHNLVSLLITKIRQPWHQATASLNITSALICYFQLTSGRANAGPSCNKIKEQVTLVIVSDWAELSCSNRADMLHSRLPVNVPRKWTAGEILIW